MTMADFKQLKQDLKAKSVTEVSDKSGWSATTLRRVKKARSFKQYREFCNYR